MGKRHLISVKVKYLLVGIIIGVTFMMSAMVFASSSVTALLNNNVTLFFNGEERVLPEGYNILTYNGRTYTPARFVAEELGAEVLWDEATNSIFINYEKAIDKEVEELPEKQEEDRNTEEKKEKETKGKYYQKLPLVKMSYDATIAISHIEVSGGQTTIYVEMEGRTNDPIQLNRKKATMIVDGVVYDQSDEAGIVDFVDTRWYHDIRKEEKVSGWIKFPRIPKDAENISLYLEIFRNDGSNEVTEFEFDIVL